MKKRTIFCLLLLSLLALLAFSACTKEHTHTGGERCAQKAVCEICGELYGEPAGHLYEYSSDQSAHTYFCTREGCNDLSGRAAHSGGVATCSSEGVCSVCGYTYLPKKNHKYTGATCTQPGKCTYCGETGGNTLSHKFSGATCVQLGTCTTCGETGGNLLSHKYAGATCTQLGKCTVCGTEGGKLLSHVYEGSSCIQPGICNTCGASNGEYLPHDYQGATCIQLGTCTTCGGQGGEYASTHTLPSGADNCTLCGIDYFSATLEFTLSDTKDSYIVSSVGTCDRKVIIIPATYRGLPVTQIGAYAFWGVTNLFCRSITEVRLPDSIVKIGEEAFGTCKALEQINLPEGLTVIDNAALSDTGIKTLTLPESLTTIGYSAFAGCKNLTQIVIPKNVTSIGNYAFAECKNLTYLELHDGITSLETAGMITGCTSLESIRLPSSVTQIGEAFAWRCSSLKTVEFGSEILSIGMEAFSGCTSLTSIDLGSKLETIGSYAFLECKSLTSITMPNTVKRIESHAFDSCSSLRKINLSSGIEFIGEDIFASCDQLEYNTYSGIRYLGNEENPYLILVSLTDPTVKAVTVHADTRIISSNAFYKAAIESLTLNDGLVLIGDSAFFGCNSLCSALVIPDSVRSIQKYAFYECRNIPSLTIGKNTETIGDSALRGLLKLAEIKVAPENKVFRTAGNCLIHISDKTLLLGCNSSVIPDDGSVEIIGEHAFEYLDGLTGIIIPDSVTFIRTGAFYSCKNLQWVVIGASVNEIAMNSFEKCEKLQAVYFKGSSRDWNSIDFHDGPGYITIGEASNDLIKGVSRYYYSENFPTSNPNKYWHYVDGKPILWQP